MNGSVGMSSHLGAMKANNEAALVLCQCVCGLDEGGKKL